jgi:putative ABC transport system permease protein
MKFFHIIWSNLKRKKARTLLTLLSILVAFVLFGFLSAVKHALTGGITIEGANRLVVRHKVSIIQLLPASYKEKMEKISGVTAAAHQTFFGGVYQDSKNFFMQCPVVPDEFMAMYPEFVLPPEQKAAWLATRTGAIVGRQTAQKFGWKIGDKVPIRSNIWAKNDGNRTWEFDIVGIFDGANKSADTTAFYFRYDYFDEARSMEKGQVGWYSIRVKDPNQTPEIAKKIDQEFENSSYETKTEAEGAFVQGWVRQIGNIALITFSIMGAVFFTILLVAGNTMGQAVRERTGELGVLKALGFTNTQVLTLVLVESCLMAVLGGILGLGFGWMMISRGDPTHGYLPLFFLTTRDLLIGLGLTLVLGICTGIVPALQAMRLKIAVALRKM